MHPVDCQWWEYKDSPYSGAVPIRCEAILTDLGHGRIDIESNLRDARPLHKRIFENLTPRNQPYLAGHYRGEKFKCLLHLRVEVKGDKRVGAVPERVAPEMANFYSHIVKPGLKSLVDAFGFSDERLAPEEKFNYLVKFSCRVLVEFLRIHPYANGNGHVGRLIVWMITIRFGFTPLKWPLDEHPPYDNLLSRYRDGEEQPLEDFVHRAFAGLA